MSNEEVWSINLSKISTKRLNILICVWWNSYLGANTYFYLGRRERNLRKIVSNDNSLGNLDCSFFKTLRELGLDVGIGIVKELGK